MKLLLLLATILISGLTFGQEATTHSTTIIDAKTNHSNDWEIYIANLDFKIEYKFENCDPSMGFNNESVLFRITNRTNQKIVLDWQMHKYYDGECNSCNYPDEYHYEVGVGPNGVVEGNCSVDSNYQLKVFSKFNDPNYSKGKQLTQFQLFDLKLTTY